MLSNFAQAQMELQNSSAIPMLPIIQSPQHRSANNPTHRPLIDKKNKHYPNPAVDSSKSSGYMSKLRAKPQYLAAVHLVLQIPRLVIEDELQQYQ
jgi:hypothetical protein